MSAVDAVTLPPVVCASWCEDGDGHTDAWRPNDQYCSSAEENVQLTAMPLLTFDGKVAGRDWLGAYLLREHNSTVTTVELVHNDLSVAKLTPAEAVELGRLLVRQGEQAAGGQGR